MADIKPAVINENKAVKDIHTSYALETFQTLVRYNFAPVRGIGLIDLKI